MSLLQSRYPGVWAVFLSAMGSRTLLSMRFDSGGFDAGQGLAMNEVTAYGTAVVVEPH